MLIAERRRLLLEQVHHRGYVSFRELAEALEISESTVRRDLRSMVDEGLLVATRGGVGPIRQPRPAGYRGGGHVGADRPAGRAEGPANGAAAHRRDGAADGASQVPPEQRADPVPEQRRRSPRTPPR